MDYEGLKNTIDFVRENAKQISYLTAMSLFDLGVIGYYIKETIKHAKNERGGLEQKTN